MKLAVRNLSFSYGLKEIIDIDNQEFESSNIYGIVGRNGAGKTTFFKLLTNIIVSYAGDVIIGGEVVKNNPAVLSDVGIVLDDMELYKHQSGLFNLRYFGGLRGSYNEAKALQLAQELDLAADIHNKVGSYSLGMSKKLILLIAIMNDAQILILDEPFRGLDSKSVTWFKDYLLNLKEEGKMIFISSHIQDDIEALSDKVLVLENGQFANQFDLRTESLSYIYQVEVNKPEEFSAFLEEKSIQSQIAGKLVRFTLDDEAFKELFKEVVAKGIEFYQIKKESQFTELVK